MNTEYRLGSIDLCCGMGGLSYAAKEVGIIPLVGVDTNQAAIQTFSENFPDAIPLNNDVGSDVCIEETTRIMDDRSDEFDEYILISGPPCQGFSVAGNGRLDDPRSSVMISVSNAIVKLGPIAAVVENVPAIETDRFEKIFNVFINTLTENGYFIQRFILNALEYGTPQRRERLIFFITKFPLDRQYIKSEMENSRNKAQTIERILGDLPHPKVRPDDYDPQRDKSTPQNHYAMKHSPKVKRKIAKIPIGKGPLSYRKLNPNGQSCTLISGHRAPPVHYSEPRSITTREALRLQGFPDSFRVMGSFGKQMEQVTNAVPLQLGKAVLRTVVKHFAIGVKHE